MKDNKRWAIICWVLSVLIFLANLFQYEGNLTHKEILDLMLVILLLIAGFLCWRQKGKKEA